VTHDLPAFAAHPRNYGQDCPLNHVAPILTYHSLDETGSVISVSPSVFRRHMEMLASWGYAGVTVRQLIEAWDGRSTLPPRCVVLTFDDAYSNFAEVAAPILTRLGFTATIFVVAQYAGGSNTWPTQGPGIPTLPLMSWNALRDLATGGFEIGSHTMTHPDLTSLPPERARWELSASRAEIEDRLGGAVTSLAYPYGLATPANRKEVAQHYRAACSVRLGRARRNEDRLGLRRIDMYYYRNPALFRFFPTPAGTAYLALRGIGRALRAMLGARRGPTRL
jgi:peptidoglycan/xylan/chitin deacetylase (PgdA/CDA1 family)